MKRFLLMLVLALAAGAAALGQDTGGDGVGKANMERAADSYWRPAADADASGKGIRYDDNSDVKYFTSWSRVQTFTKDGGHLWRCCEWTDEGTLREDLKKGQATYRVEFVDDDTMTLTCTDGDSAGTAQTWVRMKPAAKADKSEVFDHYTVDFSPGIESYFAIEADCETDSNELWVQMSYVVEKTGRLSNITIYSISDERLKKSLLASLAQAKVLPAIKDGKWVRCWETRTKSYRVIHKTKE